MEENSPSEENREVQTPFEKLGRCCHSSTWTVSRRPNGATRGLARLGWWHAQITRWHRRTNVPSVQRTSYQTILLLGRLACLASAARRPANHREPLTLRKPPVRPALCRLLRSLLPAGHRPQ